MQVNRLSLGLQEALKTASNFNTARSDTLFDKGKYGVAEDGEIDFGSLNIEELDISEDQIKNLLEMFSDEVIAYLSGDLPDMFGKDPQNKNASQNQSAPQGQEQKTPNVFTA